MNVSPHSSGPAWLDALTRLPGWAVVAATALLLVVAVVAWCIHARANALRAIDVVPPSDAELAAARQAGASLATRGPLGLVLAGGGAKGAYQIGCWKALRECGIGEFGAIAGCSVGSLNAVLVAQGDLEKAERIWREMRFGRVFRLHWHFLIALLIRVVLVVPYLGKHAFPARAINVPMWRAVTAYRSGDPRRQLDAVVKLYLDFVGRSDSTDIVSDIVLAIVALVGTSVWWVLAAPVLSLAAMLLVVPLIVMLVVAYASWLAALLDQLSTRMVLATNEPLHRLLVECVDLATLASDDRPLFVTLASLREVTRTPPPKPLRIKLKATPASKAAPADKPPSWWRRNVVGEGDNAEYSIDFAAVPNDGNAMPAGYVLPPFTVTTVEYVPTHFDVRKVAASDVNELVLQSAGLPEMFPARKFGDDTYVDGGVTDLVPVAALAGVPGLAAIVVSPLDAQIDDAAVRKSLAATLEKLGRADDAKSLPELVVFTPSRPLGNFLTGTLDFAAVRARALLTMGYRDTIRTLARRAAADTATSTP